MSLELIGACLVGVGVLVGIAIGVRIGPTPRVALSKEMETINRQALDQLPKFDRKVFRKAIQDAGK